METNSVKLIKDQTTTSTTSTTQTVAQSEGSLFDATETETTDVFENITEENGFAENDLAGENYNYHYKEYQKMKQKYGNGLTFKGYMSLMNVGVGYILQRIENYMETGDASNGNGIARDKLDSNRCVANPDNKNEEVYWNEDESKYYLIDWDKGIYKQVDPKEIPYLQENPQDPPRTEGDAPVVDLGGEPPAVEEDFVDDEQPIITEEELQRLQDLDPIGYTDSNGNTFDFVIDRNNDGVFNNASEFLGAIGNWSEMEKLDKDGNGIIEGSELSGIMLLKTGLDGVQTFLQAMALNIKIYLDSYFEADKDEKDENGNTVLGDYELSVNGQNYSGYNTLDSMDYLNKKYGNMFEKQFAS